MKHKVIVISEYRLHEENGAASERLKCYARAVPNVDFICLSPYRRFAEDTGLVPSKNISNLSFHSSSLHKNSYAYRNFMRYFDIVRPILLCRFVIKHYRDSKILLYSSLLPLFIVVIIVLKQFYQFTVIVEKNELEAGIVRNTIAPQGIAKLLYYFFFPIRYLSAIMVDGLSRRASTIILISENLMKKYGCQDNCLLIPILVDYKRFKSISGVTWEKILSFVYIGAITPNKDGIFLLLRSINNLKKESLEFKVDIVGSGSKQFMNKVNLYINRNNLADIVTIKSPVESQEIPGLLKHHNYGLLIRECNQQTKYGFSTKLGEYLAAGLPVIYSNVSDNTLYLKDGHHGYLVEFPLEKHLDQTLRKAIQSTPQQGVTMSHNANRLARSTFDYERFSMTLKSIFN